jgi:hypothetical protein
VNDNELRALVRDAVRRHVAPSPAATVPQVRPPADLAPQGKVHPPTTTHLSHAMYLTLVNPGEACLIEPAVACNHCGYCQCHGH